MVVATAPDLAYLTIKVVRVGYQLDLGAAMTPEPDLGQVATVEFIDGDQDFTTGLASGACLDHGGATQDFQDKGSVRRQEDVVGVTAAFQAYQVVFDAKIFSQFTVFLGLEFVFPIFWTDVIGFHVPGVPRSAHVVKPKANLPLRNPLGGLS